MKKKLIYLICSILFLTGVFLIYQSQQRLGSKDSKPKVYVQQNLFHPDEVLEINFVFDQNKFQFKRTQRLEFWSKDSFTTSKVHQSLLYLASMISDQASPNIQSQVIRIAFKTDDMTDWIWVSDGENYRWDAGPHKLKGGVLNEKQKAFFATREKVFVTQKGVFCQKRPLQFSSDKKILLNQKGTWFLLGKIYSDQNAIEKWLGRNCKFQIENLISNEVMNKKEEQLTKKIKIKESAQVSRELSWSDEGYILIDEAQRKKMIFDLKLVEELNLMKTILDQAQL